MYPSYIIDATASKHDHTDTTTGLIHRATTLLGLILSNGFDENGTITAPHDVLLESLWIVIDTLNDAEKISALILQDN